MVLVYICVIVKRGVASAYLSSVAKLFYRGTVRDPKSRQRKIRQSRPGPDNLMQSKATDLGRRFDH